MGPAALLPIRRKVFCGFLSPLKVHRLARVPTRDLWSSGKHTNQYNTKATTSSLSRLTGYLRIRRTAVYEHSDYSGLALSIGIAGSDATRDVGACPRVSVLSCGVYGDALRRADPCAQSPAKCAGWKIHNFRKVLLDLTGFKTQLQKP
jgi:hypothetical protein